jgi:hypothetical protein
MKIMNLLKSLSQTSISPYFEKATMMSMILDSSEQFVSINGSRDGNKHQQQGLEVGTLT